MTPLPPPPPTPPRGASSSRTAIVIMLAGLAAWLATLYYFVELIRGAIDNYPG